MDQSKNIQPNQKVEYLKQNVRCPWITTQPYPSSIMNKNRNCQNGNTLLINHHSNNQHWSNLSVAMDATKTFERSTNCSIQQSSTQFFHFLRLMQLFPNTHPATLHTVLYLCRNDFFCAVDKLLYARRFKMLYNNNNNKRDTTQQQENNNKSNNSVQTNQPETSNRNNKRTHLQCTSSNIQQNEQNVKVLKMSKNGNDLGMFANKSDTIHVEEEAMINIENPKRRCQLIYQPGKLEPMILNSKYEFIYPVNKDNHTVEVSVKETIILSCPGSTVQIGNLIRSDVKAICVSGSTFEVDGKTIELKNVSCSTAVVNTARYTNKKCEQNGNEIEIGFDLKESGRFIRLIQICFDPVLQASTYSHYNLTKQIGTHEVDVATISFKPDNFYNVSPTSLNTLYTVAVQRVNINKQLGLSTGSIQYIQNDNIHFLARGHFTAKADFVYGFQQLATFHYVNVAPQFQGFNGRNWNYIEERVRNYAEEKNVDLRVYTGSFNITTLPHFQTNKSVSLYLYPDKNVIPVPQFYWKVVYNPATLKAIALLGLNNIYVNDVSSQIICKDVWASIPWLDANRKNVEAGFMYACEVNDFRNAVKYLPAFQTNGLLI